MSEEEIIEKLKKLLEDKISIEEIRTMNLLNENDEMPYTLTIFEREALQGLLDLYNKEKEKRINLEQELETRKWIKVKENGEVEPLFYISKDKMKEKINYYEERGYIEIAGAFKLLLEEDTNE